MRQRRHSWWDGVQVVVVVHVKHFQLIAQHADVRRYVAALVTVTEKEGVRAIFEGLLDHHVYRISPLEQHTDMMGNAHHSLNNRKKKNEEKRTAKQQQQQQKKTARD